MEKILVLLLILPLIGLSFYLFVRKKYFSFSIFEIFIIFFTIYFVLVPVDHLLGLSIREHASFLSLNADEYRNDSTLRLLEAILLYFYFFVFICIGYSLLKLKFAGANKRSNSQSEIAYKRLYVPSPKVLLFLNVAVLYYYISTDLAVIAQNIELVSSLKQVRTQVGLNVDSSYRLFSYVSNLFVTFNTVVIIIGKEKRLTTIALISISMMALYMGDRSTIFIAFFVALLVHKPKLHHAKAVLGILMCMVVFIYFKPTYNFVIAEVAGKDHLRLPESFAQIDFSFSRIEGLSPYEVLITVMNDEYIVHRYGESYLQTTVKTILPGSIYKSNEETLAVEYKKKYAPMSMGYFGFSPIAESIVNFGIFGPLLIGLLFGMYLFGISSLKIGLLYYLNIMFIIRFFRTDFASLVKRYYMVELSAIVISLIVLSLVFILIQLLKTKRLN